MSCVNHGDVSEGLNSCARCGQVFCQDCLVELSKGWYCATCKTEQVKDIKSGVDSSVLPLAGLGSRLAARIIDGILSVVVVVILMLLLGGFNSETSQSFSYTFYGLYFLFLLLYESLMLHAYGQTLGKMAAKVKVVTPEGQNITGGQSWGRTFVYILLSFVHIVDWLPACFTKQKTCVHDMAAKTRVIKL